MVFIVSDQRIATENFEKGKIYKVVFLDESTFYGVCLGIGSNFVMLSGNISGYLFPLTMETASQVESIDLFDPTPPEPPVPWTNLLQYQTGEPPFTFNTTDDQLFSWYITGAGVGDKTANLFDKSVTSLNAYPTGGVIAANAISRTTYCKCEPNTTYTVSKIVTSRFSVSYSTSSAIPNIGTSYYGVITNHTASSITITTGENAEYLIIFYYNTNYDTTPEQTIKDSIMVNVGSTALPYEPYGQYKIPIVCGGQTTNIYIDNPLGADDILYSTQTGIQIPTIVGDNTLSVNTTVQPSEMQIVYKIADR